MRSEKRRKERKIKKKVLVQVQATNQVQTSLSFSLFLSRARGGLKVMTFHVDIIPIVPSNSRHEFCLIYITSRPFYRNLALHLPMTSP